MLFQLITLALLGYSHASPVARSTSPFSIVLEAPKSVESVEDLWVKATLTNNGPATANIDPFDTVFGSSPTDDFIVDGSAADGKAKMASFIGMFAKHVTDISQLQKLGVLIPVPAGQSISNNVSLAGRYDLTASGAGDYTITTRNIIRHVQDGESTAKSATAEVKAVQVKITGVLGRKRSLPVKREVTFNGCSAEQQAVIQKAATNAQAGSQAAAANLNEKKTDTAYTTWFGAADDARLEAVTKHYTAMDGLFANVKYDCAECSSEAATFAQVQPDDITTIYLCGHYWEAPSCGTDSQQGTLVHEASHFTKIGATQDNTYGQENTKALAVSDPATAIENADNHEYYEEEIFTACSA